MNGLWGMLFVSLALNAVLCWALVHAAQARDDARADLRASIREQVSLGRQLRKALSMLKNGGAD